MIFVSYSHQDETWRKRFETMAKPLSRAESMRFWSDKDIRAGEWEKQIEAAMRGAVAAVLLVSDNFLASDYIIEKELPHLMRAHTEQSDDSSGPISNPAMSGATSRSRSFRR